MNSKCHNLCSMICFMISILVLLIYYLHLWRIPIGSPLAPLGENVAVKPELLFPFAPLRENKEFKTDALSGHGLTATLYLNDSHWTSEGHKVAAQIVFKGIINFVPIKRQSQNMQL